MVRRGAGAGFESPVYRNAPIAYNRIVFAHCYSHALTEDEGGIGERKKRKTPTRNASEFFCVKV